MKNEGQVILKFSGVNDVVNYLNSLPDSIRGRVEKAMLRGGGVPIRKAAKRHAAKSKDTGLLQKSIGLSVKTIKGVTSVRVGPRSMRQTVTRTNKKTGKKYQEIADPNKYSHLVEYGTAHSPAKPFIRPAIDETQDQILDAMALALDKHLTRHAAKARKLKK